MQKIDITSQEDLEKLLDVIMLGEKFEIGIIEPIPIVLRLAGERFAVQDGYISAEYAENLVTFKREYHNFLANTIGKNKAKSAEILFKIEDGSIKLDFLNELPKELWETVEKVVGKMESKHLAVTIVLSLMAYFAYSSWQDYLSYKKEELQVTAKTDTEKEAMKIASKAIDALMEDKKLEAAKNKPINQLLSKLQDGEVLEIGNKGKKPAVYKASDISKFSYNDEIDDVTVTLTENFTITGFEKKPYGWDLHIKAISKETKPRTFWATSKLTPDDNIKLFHAADQTETKNFTVTIVKNRDKIKEAYITAINQ